MHKLSRRGAGVIGGAVSLVLLAAACSGGSSGSETSRSTAAGGGVGSTSTRAQGVNPNAQETQVAGDIPDTQVYVAYAGQGYTIKVPQGWARADTATGAVFTDHFNTERFDRAATPTAPTEASVRTVTVPQLQSSNNGFTLKSVSTVSRPAGTVVMTAYQANSAPDPVTNKYVVLEVERFDFWKNGTMVTVTLSAPKGSDNVDPWKTMTDSFAWQ